ncbi:Hypp290 [Branchiostoma lanceolatum]|uniref:Hypp290 protein n=1 Tax=Branchiostoma lanceolatum TaxID=7740 RepID=A0A8J9YN12_BRALA|nr:Hypp290 [Branchiostoma lanceolatum]
MILEKMASAFVWNFFKPPKSGNLPKLIEYWFYVGNHGVKSHPDYLATHLHKNIQPNPKWVYVNFGIFKTDGFIMTGPNKNPVMKQAMEEASKLKPDAEFMMGGFAEAAVTTGESPYPYERPNTHRYLISHFAVPDDIPAGDFEASWKDLTGVDVLEKAVTPEMGYVFSSLYRRVTPHGPYRYVVRSEFSNLHDKEEVGFGLVEKLRDFFGTDALASKKIEADAALSKVVIEMQLD